MLISFQELIVCALRTFMFSSSSLVVGGGGGITMEFVFLPMHIPFCSQCCSSLALLQRE